MLLHLLISLFLWPPHGDLDLRIASLTATIAQYPDSTLLYLARGEVYILHEDYTLALADFDRCSDVGIDNARLHTGLGTCYAAIANADSALHHFDIALQQDPELFSVIEAKARLLELMQQPCAGALLYEAILAEASHPGPSVFIDASQMWLQCSEPDARQKSIATLESGIARLGRLHVLQKEMVKQYIATGEFEKAIQWQSSLVNDSASPSPLLDRAQLYLQSGETALAAVDIESALTRLEAYPPHRQTTQGFQHMLARATEMQKQINR